MFASVCEAAAAVAEVSTACLWLLPFAFNYHRGQCVQNSVLLFAAVNVVCTFLGYQFAILKASAPLLIEFKLNVFVIV